PGRDLRQGASGALGYGRSGGRRPGLRSGLVAAEVAVTLVLVVGAGLLVRSLAELQAVDRGVDPEGLLVFEYSLPRTSGWADDPVAFHQAYLERLRELPGVASASLGCAVPLGGHCMITMVRQAGATTYPEGSRPEVGVDFVDHEFFETLGVPLLRGRTFDRRDRSDSPPVAVLNETASRRLFPNGEAVGRKLSIGTSLTPEGAGGAEVVGIVGDVLYDAPDKGVMPEVYLSMHQQEGGSKIFVRAAGEPMALLAPARALLARLDPDVPLYGARTLADQEARATADTRVLGGLLAVFAALALLLAATGVWAVVAHTVVRRTRELGLRVALGAVPGSVVALVVRQGAGPAVTGVALGIALAWAGGRALQGLLYEVSPTDPVTLAAGALFLLAVSAAAAWLPARRATRIDPMEALRTE
ncbi:MAG: ABC transporter permease, partial [Acidobacteriota bacterium]